MPWANQAQGIVMKHLLERIPVSIIRCGMEMEVGFCELKANDIACLPCGDKFRVGEDAHVSGDSTYEGWVVYDEFGNSYFPEDFDGEIPDEDTGGEKAKCSIAVGSDYIFFFRFSDGDCLELLEHNGRKCTVTCQENKEHYQGETPWERIESCGGLFEVRFATGDEFCVYGEELEPIYHCEEVMDGFYCKKVDSPLELNFTALLALLPKNPEDSRHGFWTDGDEILCKKEAATEAVANFLEDLGIDIVLTGFYDPEEPPLDEHSGYHYISIQ